MSEEKKHCAVCGHVAATYRHGQNTLRCSRIDGGCVVDAYQVCDSFVNVYESVNFRRAQNCMTCDFVEGVFSSTPYCGAINNGKVSNEDVCNDYHPRCKNV